MKYFVTYCASDQDVGANPLWHSSILLSQWEEGKDKIEVLHNWGFYGMPTSENKDSLLGKIRISLGLDIYLTGNHGMFKEEDTRFYDRGKGLHGASFELTHSQCEQLKEECNRIIAEQEAAIREVVEPQGIKGKPLAEVRHHTHEEFSSLIYALEQIKAKQQGREPRLKPFYLSLSVGFWGLSTETSKNCKTQSLSVLAKILNPEQICRLTDNGNHPTIPRKSGKMEDIYLHSTGPLREYTRKSGDKEYYRNVKEDSEVKLYWTIPPQEFEALSEDTNVFHMDKTYCERIKPLVKRLQALEWLVRNADVPQNLKPYKQSLIRQIIERYTCFSVIKEKQPTSAMGEWHARAFSLFLLPKNTEEKALEKQIERGNDLLNSLYMAIVDNWVIEDEHLLEDPSSLEYLLSESTLPTSPVEAIASYFSVKDKQHVCSILGRSYCEEVRELTQSNNLLELQ
jgi:hypothetical protein